MKTRPQIIHRIAQCEDCDWEAQNYRTAGELARKHFEKTLHTVVLETATSSKYITGFKP